MDLRRVLSRWDGVDRRSDSSHGKTLIRLDLYEPFFFCIRVWIFIILLAFWGNK